jgi:hypothetical protein
MNLIAMFTHLVFGVALAGGCRLFSLFLSVLVAGLSNFSADAVPGL